MTLAQIERGTAHIILIGEKYLDPEYYTTDRMRATTRRCM